MSNCTNYFCRGGGDLLRQLHNLAEAEANLAEHQKRLFAIEAKVYCDIRYEESFVHADEYINLVDYF